jgi:hypothetical protein
MLEIAADVRPFDRSGANRSGGCSSTAYAIVDTDRRATVAGVLMIVDGKGEALEIAHDLLRRGLRVEVVEWSERTAQDAQRPGAPWPPALTIAEAIATTARNAKP